MPMFAHWLVIGAAACPDLSHSNKRICIARAKTNHDEPTLGYCSAANNTKRSAGANRAHTGGGIPYNEEPGQRPLIMCDGGGGSGCGLQPQISTPRPPTPNDGKAGRDPKSRGWGCAYPPQSVGTICSKAARVRGNTRTGMSCQALAMH